MALTKVKPAGNSSVTSMFVAFAPPLFSTKIVKATTSPTFTKGLLTVLLNSRSAASPPIVTWSWSSSVGSSLSGSESSSGWSAAVTSAIFGLSLSEVTVATISKVAVPAAAISPTFQIPVVSS